MTDNCNTILGIDPGTTVMGFAIITVQSNKISLVAMDSIDLRKIDDPYEKLKTIFMRITALIDQYKPNELAIEAPFYGLNVQSMLKLGRAQGVAIAASLAKGLDVHEYAPKKVKLSITGNGSASKEQLAGMLQQMLSIKEMPKLLDASDALGVAVCHSLQAALPQSGSSVSSWKAFIAQNPKRVK